MFSAQAQNQFGSSAFSGNSDLITTGTGMLCVHCVMCLVVCVCLSAFVCMHVCMCGVHA